MDSQNPNRNTQFEMEGLAGLEQSTPLPEPEGHLTPGPQRLQDRQVLKKNAAKRKRSPSPKRDGVVRRPGIRYKYKGMKDESPWEHYWKIFQLKFDRFVTVAVQKEPLRKCVIVKRFSESDCQEGLRIIYNIRHNHIITVFKTFRFEGSFYVVLERIAISLVQIVASPPYPGEQELAAILGQVYPLDVKSRSMY